MKKISILLLGLVAVAIASCEKNDPQPVQPVEPTWKADSMVSVGASSKSRRLYTYDQRGNMIELLSQTFDKGEYVPSTKTLYTYNSLNLNTEINDYNFKNSVYVQTFKEENTYNDKNLLVTYKRYNKNGETLPLSSMKEYTYYESGKQLSSTTTSYTKTPPAYTYTDTTFYDALGRDSLNRKYKWTNQAWELHYKTEFTYIADTCRQMGYQKTDTGWKYGSKTEYIYDAQGREIEEISYMLTNDETGFDYLRKKVFAYDANGNIATETTYFPNTSGGWKLSHTDTYYYSKH